MTTPSVSDGAEITRPSRVESVLVTWCRQPLQAFGGLPECLRAVLVELQAHTPFAGLGAVGRRRHEPDPSPRFRDPGVLASRSDLGSEPGHTIPVGHTAACIRARTPSLGIIQARCDLTVDTSRNSTRARP
jgi:hypothetical protein